MSISDNDYKLLWGRAAGICSNPSCREDLTILLEGATSYNVGEMAHIIAHSPSGPRGNQQGGSDKYDNLILLCPTCHRTIDKSPEGLYPIDLLNSWKIEHEAVIRSSGSEKRFSSLNDLKKYVNRMLMENRANWEAFGPQSETARRDLGSNLHILWTLRKLDTIVPNNIRIVNVVNSNIELLEPEEFKAFIDFKIHASAFEDNQLNRLDSYPTFPLHFAELFSV
ncbi:HNH endonuclease signature motif containing protein [Methylophilus sp. 'Pure River']|uniref:HNH endonuclease signature motif containing protein n=1 Tax=Methylophilus sp. 'Pure River' TaxID=3377117 RepID=UPI00398F84BA